jgi:lipoprotein-releasing system ATP-binding protein
MNDRIALHCSGLRKTYVQGSAQIAVLQGVEIEVGAAERVAILGRSGSGKSTLLHILGGLADGDSGEVWVAGESMTRMSSGARAKFRNAQVGFVYQLHHLLPEFSALENVAMPLLLGGRKPSDAAARAAEMLGAVGLADRASHRPNQLSGGERQRVAIARALVARPALVLADEPTGNLDRESAESVFRLMVDLAEQVGTAFVVVTHDEALARALGRRVYLADGRLHDRWPDAR